MTSRLLTTAEAANALGISKLTLYDWLAQSDASGFLIRGQPVTVSYFQGGRKGQGRIRIAESEVSRLLSLMAVTPRTVKARKPSQKHRSLQHITARPGRPDD